jgi:hypothetical protein
MASPSGAALGNSASWKSPMVLAQEKYNRLNTVGYHAGFTKSPFWPKNIHQLNMHKAQWQSDLALQYKNKLDIHLLQHRRRILQALMFEPPDLVKELTGWCRKKNISQESPVVISGCMERIRKEFDDADAENLSEAEFTDLKERVEHVIREFKETIEIDEIKNNNVEKGLSKVLGLKTKYWKGNEAQLAEGKRNIITDESRAYWPTNMEFKAAGDDNIRNKQPRRLPIPKLDMLSKKRAEQFFASLNGCDEEADMKLICEMIQLTGHQIEPEHRAVAEYEGPIDSLGTITSKYAQNWEQKKQEMPKELTHVLLTTVPSATHELHKAPLVIQSAVSTYSKLCQEHCRYPHYNHSSLHHSGITRATGTLKYTEVSYQPEDSNDSETPRHLPVPYTPSSHQPCPPFNYGDNDNASNEESRNNKPRSKGMGKVFAVLADMGSHGSDHQELYDASTCLAVYDKGNDASASLQTSTHQPCAMHESQSGRATLLSTSGYNEQKFPGNNEELGSILDQAIDGAPEGIIMDETSFRELVGWDDLLTALDA